MNKIAVAFAVLALASCRSGGGDSGGGDVSVNPGGVCTYISGGDTSTLLTSGCPQCTASDAALAIDGDADTFATITYPAFAQGAMALRAVAQDGITYPGGSQAGFIWSVATPIRVSTDFDVRTYLSGAPTNTDDTYNFTVVTSPQGMQRASISTVAPFDAVEIGITRGPATEETIVRVHEFCSD